MKSYSPRKFEKLEAVPKLTGFWNSCLEFIRVVQKLQFLNNNHLKMVKCRAFYRTCSRTNRVLEQVYLK
jgi:hypothetical protein